MIDCLFCELQKQPKNTIFKSKLFYSQFDKFPVSPGHCEVIPKRHVVSIFDLTNLEWAELNFAIKQTIKVVENTNLKNVYTQYLKNPLNEKMTLYCNKMVNNKNILKKPDGYNIGNNEGLAAGRTINHLHIHIIPRYLGDVDNCIGGIRNIIPGMGNYK